MGLRRHWRVGEDPQLGTTTTMCDCGELTTHAEPAAFGPHREPPRWCMYNHQVWVWMAGAPEPHWAVRGTGFTL